GRLQHRRRARGDARVAQPRAPAARARAVRTGFARRAGRGAGRGRRACRAASAGPAAARFRDRRPPAGRNRGVRLGDAGRGGRLRPRPQAVTSDLVYGRQAVREALRGRREVLEVWATDRAAAGEPWLAETKVKL